MVRIQSIAFTDKLVRYDMNYLHSYKYTDMYLYINKYQNMNDVATFLIM